MPRAILKPIEEKWQVVIVDEDLCVIWSDPLPHDEAVEVAHKYNLEEMIVRADFEGRMIYGRLLSLN